MILIFLNVFQLLYSKLCTNISSTLSPSLFRNNSSMPRRQTMKSSAILRPWRHLCNDLSEGHYIKSYKACSFLFVRSTTDFWNLSPNYGEFPMVGKCKEDICQDVMTQHGKHHPWVQSGWGATTGLGGRTLMTLQKELGNGRAAWETSSGWQNKWHQSGHFWPPSLWQRLLKLHSMARQEEPAPGHSCSLRSPRKGSALGCCFASISSTL